VAQWHVTEAPEDAELVSAARDGDRNAFGRLYSRYSGMVHGILLAHVPSTEIEDLVQDIFLLALPRLNALRDIRRFGEWLAAITRNRAKDYHRHSQTPAASLKGSSVEEVEVAAARRPEEMPARMILELIRSLPESYRETLILRLVEGMTGPEIAARTGLTAGSVRVNLHRGMKHLREKLRDEPDNTSAGGKPGSRIKGTLLARWKQMTRKRNAR